MSRLLTSILKASGLFDPWAVWPRWDCEGEFRTRHLRFTVGLEQYDLRTTAEHVVLLKNRKVLDHYRNLLRRRKVKRILEIGIFQGGMLLFLADLLRPKRVVGIDLAEPSDVLRRVVKRAGHDSRIRMYGGVRQDDREAIRTILDRGFGGEPLDLVIDDCSHQYEAAKASFEACFGYLRPGGLYVIEDWGWAHWKDDLWQHNGGYFAGKPPLTNLIFELVMALGTNKDLVSWIGILSPGLAMMVRGPALPHKQPLDLCGSYLTAGRRFVPL